MYYSIGEYSRKINTSVKTLQMWDRIGKYKPALKSPSGRRKYSEKQYQEYIKNNNKDKKSISYIRIDSYEDPIQHQQDNIKSFSDKLKISIKNNYIDISDQINFNRPQLNIIIREVSENKIYKIIIPNKDTIGEHGYDMFKTICENFHTELIVLG